MNDVSKWMTRIGLAQAKRNKYKENWEANYTAVFGDDYELNTKTKSNKHTLDIILSFLKTKVPSIYLHMPQVYLTARDGNQAAQEEAKILESYINRILSDIDNATVEIMNVLIDSFCSYGILKVVKSNSVKPHPQAGLAVMDDLGREITDPDTGELIIYPPEISEPGYSICRVSPFDFLIDERARNYINHAAWVGEEINKTLEEVASSGIYDDEIIDKLRKHLDLKDIDDWEIDVTIYEIYDKVNKKIIVICDEWQEDFLRYEDMPEWVEGDVYTVLKFNEIPGQWFPKPEISSAVGLQEEYRFSWDLLKSWARKTNPQLGIKRSFYESDVSEAKKVGDGISSFVVVSSESDVFVLNKDALSANASLREYMDVCMKDFDQIMGQAAHDRGLVGTSKFATEAAIADRHGTARDEYKANKVVRFLASTIEKLLFIVKSNQSEPEEIKNIIINIDLDIEIDIDSRSNRTKAVERKQFSEFLALLASSPLIMQSETLLSQVFSQYSIKEADKIIEELKGSMESRAEPQPAMQDNRLALSLALKHELLPPKAVDAIVDAIMGLDIPIGQSPQEPPPANNINLNVASPDSDGIGEVGGNI